MKLGNAEGTPEELTDFFQNNGLDPASFFQKADAPLSTRWIILPAAFVFASAIGLWFLANFSLQFQWPTFLAGCLATVWLSAAVHIRFKQPFVTGVSAVGCVAVLSMAFGLLTPLEVLEQLREWRK